MLSHRRKRWRKEGKKDWGQGRNEASLDRHMRLKLYFSPSVRSRCKVNLLHSLKIKISTAGWKSNHKNLFYWLLQSIDKSEINKPPLQPQWHLTYKPAYNTVTWIIPTFAKKSVQKIQLKCFTCWKYSYQTPLKLQSKTQILQHLVQYIFSVLCWYQLLQQYTSTLEKNEEWKSQASALWMNYFFYKASIKSSCFGCILRSLLTRDH